MPNKQDSIRQLRDEAVRALHSARYEEALKHLNKLENLQPSEAEWPHRAADCHRARSQKEEQLKALLRAAERYLAAGFSAKAAALCRMALDLDSGNAQAADLLRELSPSTQLAAGLAKPRIPLDLAVREQRYRSKQSSGR